jgi:anti-sigma B factor antagonist
MPAPVIFSSEDLFTVTVTTGAQAVRVGATGEIDAFTAPRLATALSEALSAGVFEITVDLQDVTFLDSAGVHAIAHAYRRARAAGTSLRVRSPQRGVRRTLELSGLWSLVGDGDDSTAGITAA